MKKETAEQLEAFRKQREAAEKATLDDDIVKDEKSTPQQDELWTTQSRKRRRAKDSDAMVTGKIRKLSSSSHNKKQGSGTEDVQSVSPTPAQAGETQNRTTAASSRSDGTPRTAKSTSPSSAPKVPPSLGLGAYSSDDE